MIAGKIPGVNPDGPVPQPLDYLSTPKRPWSRRKKIVVSVLAVLGAIVLFYLGLCVVFVASNINNR